MELTSEHHHQSRLMGWVNVQAKTDHRMWLLFAIPNGGKRDGFVGAMLKAEGVKRGVPDLFLPIPSGIHHGLFIEMKLPGSGRQSVEQIWWESKLADQGYRYVLAFGWEEARDAIVAYLP